MVCANNDGSCLMRLQPVAPTPRSAVGKKQTETGREDQRDRIEKDPSRQNPPPSRGLPIATVVLLWAGCSGWGWSMKKNELDRDTSSRQSRRAAVRRSS